MSVKISELPLLSSFAGNDILAGVDTSENVTSKIELSTLKNYMDTTYTAGTNIEISNTNVVSASNVYNKTETDALIEEKENEIERLENELEAVSTIYNAFPTTSDEDESMSLDGTANSKFKKLDLKGNTSQTQYTGKNLYDLTTTSFSNSNVDITINDQEITMKTKTETNSGNLFFMTKIPDEILQNGQTYTISSIDVSGVVQSLKLQLRTKTGEFVSGKNRLDSVVYDDTYSLYVDGNIYSNLNSDIIPAGTIAKIKNIQVEKGSSATDYEPHVGGVPSPNPSYPQPVNVVSGDNSINVCGKNRLNIPDGTYSNHDVTAVVKNGVITLNGTANGTSYINVNLGNNVSVNGEDYTYSISNATTSTIEALLFDTNNSYTTLYTSSLNSKITKNDTRTYNLLSIVTPSGVALNNFIIKPQLEKGSTSTNFEPYIGNTYPIYLGVENLFDGTFIQGGVDFGSTGADTSSTNRIRSGFIQVLPNTTYTISSNNTNLEKCGIGLYKSDNSYDSSHKINAGGWNDFPTSFTTQSDTKYIKIAFRKNDNSDITPTGDYEIQLELGSKANHYTPYGTTPIELCKIGTYQDYIGRSTGKNLFDKDNANVLKVNLSSTTNISGISNSNRTLYIPIEPNTTYTISKIISSYFVIGTTESTPAFNLAYSQRQSGATASSLTITTSSTARYLVLWYYNSGSDTLTEQQILDSIMINEGSTALPYEPYGTNKCYLYKEIGKVVLDGSETSWVWSSSGVTGITMASVILAGTKSGNYLDGFSNYFSNPKSGKNANTIRFGANDTRAYIYLNENDFGTLTTFQTWLSTHNLIVDYVLATPTTIEITNTTLIEQLEEIRNAVSYDTQTNISQENNDKAFIINAEAILSLQNILDRVALLES